jgi:hypothetical protein
MTTKFILLACGSVLALSACATEYGSRARGHDPYAAAIYTGAPQPDRADHFAWQEAPAQTSANGTPFEIVSYAGIEGARRAHQLYTETEAEQLDGRCEKYVQPVATESMIDIANLCDVKLDTLVAYNPDLTSVSYAASGAIIEIPGGAVAPRGAFAMTDALTDLYAVQKNETLDAVAYRLNVSATSIMNANPEVDWSAGLSEGQIIRKPSAATMTTAPVSGNYAPPAPQAQWEGYAGGKGIGASEAGSAGIVAHAPYALKPIRSYARPSGVYPDAKLSVDKAFAKPGDSVTVTARAMPGEEVTFYSGDEPGDLKRSRTVRADETGTARATMRIKKKSNMGGVVFGARPESSSETQYSDRVGVVKLKENPPADDSGEDVSDE